MTYLNKQITAYLEDRALKTHQRQTLEILKSEPIPDGDILELGSASGKMLACMANMFPERHIEGVEIAEGLHEMALVETGSLRNVKCICADILGFEPKKQYAALIAEGVHSIFDEPEAQILSWLNILKPGGVAVIFGLFSRSDLDYKFYYRNLENNYGWEAGLNGTSLRTVSNALKELGYRFSFKALDLDFNLKRSKDPIRSYTEDIGQQKHLIVADALITHMYHLVVHKE